MLLQIKAAHAHTYINLFVCFLLAVITCSELDDPKYGSVSVAGNTPGYMAHYKCDYGYELVGEAYRECLLSGYWGGKEPVCKRK